MLKIHEDIYIDCTDVFYLDLHTCVTTAFMGDRGGGAPGGNIIVEIQYVTEIKSGNIMMFMDICNCFILYQASQYIQWLRCSNGLNRENQIQLSILCTGN